MSAVILAVAAATITTVALRWWLRRRRLAFVLQIARELGRVVGGDSELLSMDATAVRCRLGDRELVLPSDKLAHIFVHYSGEQREWHLKKLVGEAQAEAKPWRS